MKARSIITIALMVVLGLSSCDSNKSAVEDLTNQFIAAVKEGDKATVYDMYPAAKQYQDLLLPDSIEKGDLDIQKNEKDSTYTVSIKNTRMSKIIFKSTDNKTFKIVNTFSILKLDSISNELALKTGVPIKKMPDLELGKLMLESSEYMSYLINKYANNMSLSLITEMGNYAWRRDATGYHCQVNQPIKNSGADLVKGSDYSVEITVYQASTGERKALKTHQGVDLASGESFVFSDDIPELFNYARNRDISWNANIICKNQDSVKESLLNKIEFNGQEYDEYLKAKKEGKLNAAEVTDDDGSPQDDPDPNYKEEDLPDVPIPDDVVVDTAMHRR
ncbi:MAG TPA: hypothetical protein DEQ27_06295 [Prevotella sp.]|nr:hypothetical protein [Prevotella sp.]